MARDERNLAERFKEEFEELEHYPTVILYLSAVEAWALLGQIQLASRHPLNNGPTRDIVVALGKRIQAVVAVSPALMEVAEKGWDPRFDEEVE